jgi:hypothetical protein
MAGVSVEAPASSQIDAAYQSQRLRLSAAVGSAVASAWAHHHEDRAATIDNIVRLVSVGQAHTVGLVDAYMAAKSIEATGSGARIGLDPALYTTEALRGVAAATVYSRPFGAHGAFVKDGCAAARRRPCRAGERHEARNHRSAARADARRTRLDAGDRRADVGELRIVGYRRVLTGPGPHCALCTAAATRTYRISDLMAIHEHCSCTVQPLYGTEPVASIGTTVRVEDDPELGPRLMADVEPVGPRITT